MGAVAFTKHEARAPGRVCRYRAAPPNYALHPSSLHLQSVTVPGTLQALLPPAFSAQPDMRFRPQS